MNVTNQINDKRWFLIFICLHIAAWTLFPSIARMNLPLDVMEGSTWGRVLQWGYDKDPILNAWLTRLAITIGGYNDRFIYFFGQCHVAVGLFAIWRLAKKFLPPVLALVAVIILEGIQYYNVAAIDFNDNVLQVMFWPLLMLVLYNACQSQKRSDWIWLGVIAALGFLAKYYIVMLIVPMTLFLFINQQARSSLKCLGPYLALAIFMALVAPHIIWLVKHEFLTLKYSFGQVKASPVESDHFVQPLRFVAMQLSAFILPVILFSTLFIGKEKAFNRQSLSLSNFDKQFLMFIGIGPLLCNMVYAAITGNSIHVLYGMPLLSCAGIILLVITKPIIIPSRFYRLFGIVILLIVVAGSYYRYSLVTAGDTSSANYPGRTIANRITQIWRDNSSQPLPYIAGSRWLAGNIAFYSTDHPLVYMEWNPIVSTWINEQVINKQGAVFVWEIKDELNVPKELIQRFPRLKILPSETFTWLRSNATLQIGVAILPPEK